MNAQTVFALIGAIAAMRMFVVACGWAVATARAQRATAWSVGRFGRLSSFQSTAGAAGDRHCARRLPADWLPSQPVIDVDAREVR